MTNMIFNKTLGITEEDVANQDDLNVLTQWRNSIDSQLTHMLGGVSSWMQLPANAQVAYKYLFSLRKIVYRRIGDLNLKSKRDAGWVSENSRKKDRALSMKFMQVAKSELHKEEYLRLLTLAQAILNEE